MACILGYCSIDQCGVCLNGKPFLKNEDQSANDCFDRIYTYAQMQYPRYHKMDMLSKLGFLTAEILMQALPEVKTKHTAFQSAVLMANKWASLHTDHLYWESAQNIPSPSLFVCTLPNVVSAEICIRHQWKGENHFFIQPQFNPSQMMDYANILFGSQRASFCLLGWVDFFDQQYESILIAVDNSDVGLLDFTEENVKRIIKN